MSAPGRLNQDILVGTAMALADAEGLGAVTLRRLAQHHGVTPMAMYRHFRDKEDILDALAERVLADVVLPEPDHGPWDEQLHGVITALLDALRPHPNIAGLVHTRMLSCEPGLAMAERTLDLLEQAGFPVEAAADSASQILHSLVALVIAEPGRAPGADAEARDDATRATKAALSALSPRRYPHVVAAADALAACSSLERYYERGVDLVVSGVRGVRATRYECEEVSPRV
jgi:TetR/AcrR family transcriptional regulator, tetracycline repressor protein